MGKIAGITKVVILATIAIAIIYDFWAFQEGGTEATISWITAQWAYDYPAAVFGTGFLCGHLFWQMNPGKKGIK